MVNPVDLKYSNNTTEQTSANPEEALKHALYIKEPTVETSNSVTSLNTNETGTTTTDLGPMSFNDTETLPAVHHEIDTEDESTLTAIINNGPAYEYVNNLGNNGILDKLTTDINGKLSYGDNSKVTHAITGKPLAAYIIEGDAPPPPPPAVAGNLSSSGTGDPHFVGLNGARFDFHGIPGHIFNLLSDAKIQVNSLFNAWGGGGATVMGQIGIRLGNDQLLVTPGGANLNGSGLNGTANLKEGTVSHSGGTTTISTKEYTINIYDRGGYLDIGITTTDEGVNRDEVMPSGIIGQTASGNVDLSIPSFLVHDGIFGTGFASNQFGAKTKIDKMKDKIKEKYDLV